VETQNSIRLIWIVKYFIGPEEGHAFEVEVFGNYRRPPDEDVG
jgi:hypothetical protein